MNPEYAAYCQADRDFYDAPHRDRGGVAAEESFYAAARTPAPEGWETSRRGDWLSLTPSGLTLPQQGWKIHVAAALDNAESILRRVLDHCLPRRIPLKFIPGPGLLLLRNAKYADRAGSGKFITVYPHSEEMFPELCAELTALLEGEHGPYILSDLRCGDGPVHVRYGAFAARYCPGPDGRLVPAIADPTGALVPDPRGPSLRIPDWVTPPEILRPHLEARQAVGMDGMPYEIQGALHFSNGGGVYRARDTRTGKTVVLKEARPHAGLAADGADAVARLERERTALEKLAGLDCVPAVLDRFELGGHHFLALEHVPGTTLNTVFARRFPLSSADPDAERLAEHAAWAAGMHTRVERAVSAVHERGIVISDLHMSNVMVSEDESRITLLDFEAAFPAEENRRQVVANPAFVAPRDHRGTDIDRYALACLRLALLLPLTTLLAIDRGVAARLAREITRVFPVTGEDLRPAVAEILREPRYEDAGPARTGARTRGADRQAAAPEPPEPGQWPLSRDSMARAITASLTPEREDRCFPGDIAQFASPAGGQSFAHGAAGVLYALHRTGAPPCPEAVEWLLDKVKEPASGTPVGFYDGLAGIAWTLDRLGHREQAAETARLIARQPLEGLTPDLHGGHAGIALALDDLAGSATGAEATALRRAADRCTALAARALASGPPSARTGLLHGATGLALLFVRRYERTGDPALLDLAATALRRDLARCKPGPDGALMVVDGKRLMPYLGGGSAGLATVLDDYLAHRHDEAFEAARRQIEPGLRSAFYVQPGLFRGVAGLILHLVRTPLGDPGERRRAIDRHTGLLGRQATPYAGELAFPGEQLMRRSMDLATGTAGCLLALGSVHRPDRAALPFLSPRESPETRPQPGAAHQ
ncbi:serine/threonine protein kinase [Streptomyces inusitatus]|uniref:Serine/threonine protein kinase n=1 Tax=Streptomyces inusitatus TaxID=68221 RepID=A0A918V2A8_9ACTN|nr:class III lanthionine synthetase LanKC [Streptomyces inusitatus]GGZ61407.1 serine/threonine protein kinase [Streptomyces inusitatus]